MKNRRDYTLSEWMKILDNEYQSQFIKKHLDPDFCLKRKRSAETAKNICLEKGSDGVFRMKGVCV